MRRLFFALWPDDVIRRQCLQVMRAIRSAGRPVSTMNLHNTLVFLGSVDDDQRIAMSGAAGTIAVQPMSLTFNRLAYWKKPAVVCLCTEQGDPAVLSLVDQLTLAAVRIGISVDKRPYKPHITLLRKAKSPPEIEFEPIVWRANGFCLVESCSTASGVEYRVIERWPNSNPNRVIN
ncbi:MAG: RNA 2',3'-cyclic phosphodiesterase [Gammaproteobacteria bacterium]